LLLLLVSTSCYVDLALFYIAKTVPVPFACVITASIFKVLVNRPFDIKVHAGNHKCDTAHSCLNNSSILFRKLGYEYYINMFIIYYNNCAFLFSLVVRTVGNVVFLRFCFRFCMALEYRLCPFLLLALSLESCQWLAWCAAGLF